MSEKKPRIKAAEVLEKLEERQSLEARIKELKKQQKEAATELIRTKGSLSFYENVASEDLKTQDEDKIARLEEKKAALSQGLFEMKKTLIELETELREYKNFDKLRCFENIRELLKGSDVKIGEIETKAGCQPGYMSRLEKEDNFSDPTVEFIVTAAKMLGVSVDYLTKATIVALSPTEEYLLSFLDRMNNETLDNKLDWDVEYQAVLNRISEESGDNAHMHPLYSYNTFFEPSGGDYPEQVTRTVFASHTYDCNTYIAGDCYNTRLKNGARLYLMKATKAVGTYGEKPAQVIEVWMVMPKDTIQYLCSDIDAGEIGTAVHNLYTTVATYMRHPKLKSDVAYIIDSFMKGDTSDDVDEDDLPW